MILLVLDECARDAIGGLHNVLARCRLRNGQVKIREVHCCLWNGAMVAVFEGRASAPTVSDLAEEEVLWLTLSLEPQLLERFVLRRIKGDAI